MAVEHVGSTDGLSKRVRLKLGTGFSLRGISRRLITDYGSLLGALRLYRFTSWFLTSLFYLLGPPRSSYLFKIGVVLSLFFAGFLADRFYNGAQGRDQQATSWHLAALEVLGIALLLPFTDGLRSPFVWYALNPLAVMAVQTPLFWCVGILLEFLLLLFILGAYFPLKDGAFPAVLEEHSYLLLTFILLTVGVRMAANLLKRSYEQTRLLDKQRRELERSWEILSTLYRLLEMAATGDNLKEVLTVFAEYSRLLLRAQKFVIWITAEELVAPYGGRLWVTAGPVEAFPQNPEVLEEEPWFSEAWKNGHQEKIDRVTRTGETGGARVFCRPVCSLIRRYGFIVVVLSGGEACSERDLTFLGDFLGVVVERCRLEELNVELLVAEEQNRIAAEIHDGVAQHLFNIACGCHLLKERWDKQPAEAVKEQLELIAQTAQRAAKELRTSIYRLTSERQGKEAFVEGAKRYIEEVAKMSGVEASLEVNGNEEVLSPALRQAFYRILREACGNAIRHGGCRKLTVRFVLTPRRSTLEIQDDGCGMRRQPDESKGKHGMGLWNMKRLAASFGGELKIESEPGKGTVVRCIVPKEKDEEQEVGNRDESSGD